MSFDSIFIGIIGLIGVLIMLIYYMLRDEFSGTRLESQEMTFLKTETKRNTKDIDIVKTSYVRTDLCLSRHDNVETKFNYIISSLDEIKEMLK